MPVLPILALFVFVQMLCIGANFSTLEDYSTQFAAEPWMVGLLWLSLTGPRAVLTPLWGAFSDRVGRRPVIFLGGAAQIAGSLLWAWGGSYWFLLASRLVDSCFSAQSAVAHSVVADSTDPGKRSASMGLMGGVVSLALTVGPVAGAVVGSQLGYRALGLGMAGAQAASLLLVALWLPETAPKRAGAVRIPLFRAELWARLLVRPGAALLIAASLLIAAGFFHYNAGMPLAARLWFGWDAMDAAKAFALVGILGAIVQGGLVRVLLRRFEEKPLILTGLALAGSGFALIALGPDLRLLWVGTGVSAVGLSLMSPCVAGLLSQYAPDGEQGAMMGLGQSVQTLGRGIGPFAAGILFPLAAVAPFISGALCFAAAAVLVALLPRVRLRIAGGKNASCDASAAGG